MRLLHPDGEVGVARAATGAGVASILSHMSGYSLEDVAAGSNDLLWYQLYKIGGIDAALSAVGRARDAGYRALVLTIDSAAVGLKERDIRNNTAGLIQGDPRAYLGAALPMFLKLPWLYGFAKDGFPATFPNVVNADGTCLKRRDAGSLSDWNITWADFASIRSVWDGPLLVKGVLSEDDARRAVDQGATGIIVSNHGGRQLDGVSATFPMVERICKAVGPDIEVIVDGGVRRGSDVAKALCAGARAVAIGRPYVYGLGAAGEAGVARVLEIYRSQLERTMILLGCDSVYELDDSYLEKNPTGWSVPA